MKKFTNIDSKESLNESVSNVNNEKLTIDKLLETLSIEIDGSDDVITMDYKIRANAKFYDGIKTIINELYSKEKIALLERARINHYLNNVTWIDTEMDIIKESVNKNKDNK